MAPARSAPPLLLPLLLVAAASVRRAAAQFADGPPASIPSFTPVVYAGGNYGDVCTAVPGEATATTVTLCRADLVCAEGTGLDPCRPASPGCSCKTNSGGGVPTTCTSNADCTRGDRCGSLGNPSGASECGGCQSFADVPSYVPIGDDSTCIAYVATPGATPVPGGFTSPDPQPSPPPSFIPAASNITGEFTAPASSASPSPVTSGGVPGTGPGTAISASTPPSPVAAPVGETGSTTENTTPSASALKSAPASAPPSIPATPSASPSVSSSVPQSPSPSPSPSPPSVCVGAHHLSGLPAHKLVFGGAHRSAPVLCDGAGSCATAGHVVVFRGAAMRMGAYCAQAGVTCRPERMLVNSPRWRRGLRVASRTEGLEFTALAARWETRLEERVLAGLVRMGA